MNATTGATTYLATSQRLSAALMRRYSSSFSAATLLLPPEARRDIASVYAYVRLADEIVDAPRQTPDDSVRIQATLAGFERDLANARADGYSTNPILHAYQEAAHRLQIPSEWDDAFLRSMRSDVGEPLNLDDYIYGSAEVIGLMCVHCFIGGPPARDLDAIYRGARGLGRAFQVINFLRDAAADHDQLGRDYLGLYSDSPDSSKRFAEATVRRDLAAAKAAVPLLPSHARAAVASAIGLFAAVEREIERRDVGELLTGERVHISTTRKTAILTAALVAHPPVPRRRQQWSPTSSSSAGE